MNSIIISSEKPKQVIDITNDIENALVNQPVKTAVCQLFLLHTTAALTTADLDPGTDLDMLDAFSAIMPKLPFRHPHNPEHVPAHIWSSIIGTSLSLLYENGKLCLGTWQRVVLIEFDGPKERKIAFRVQEL